MLGSQPLTQSGLTVGTWHLGCIVSAIATIFIGDLLGRRRTLILGLTFWVIGEIIQTSSYSFPQFIVGRAIAGFGNGFTTSTAPAYQAECVKSHRKGTILMISAGAFVSAGIALSYWFVFGFAYITSSSSSWRVPIALQIIFALPAIAMLFVLPESPRWLILTGREQEALTVLAALNDSEPDSFDTKDEFLQIKDAILIMAQGSSAVFQQGTGINLVMQYLSWIFLTRMSFDGWLARLLASCSATLYFLACFIVVVGIDRFWGRRSLMMFGAAGMSGCMILITILQYLWSEKGMQAGKIASTVFLFIFSVFFAIGWQGMAWLYQVEIVPLRIRGPANGLSTSANWLLNFVIVFITPIAFQRISYRTWIIFAATNFAILPLVYFFYPETAFRSLEEVDVIFQLADDAPGNPWLNAVHISKSEPLWFGKQDPEKRLNFNYQNSSWHKRLIESVISGNSGSGTTSGNHEKRPWSNDQTPDSEDMITTSSPPRGRKRSGESPIDPRLYCGGLSLSPATTMTTTITSDLDKTRSRRKLQKRPSRANSLASSHSFSQAHPTFGLFDTTTYSTPPSPSHHHTRSISPDSIESARPDWWTETLAPVPIEARSASTSRPGSSAREPQRKRQSSRLSSASLTNNALNRMVNPDLLAQQADGEASPPWNQHTSSTSSSAPAPARYRDGNDIEYPGIIGSDERGRERSGVVRTNSERETYLPDGVYEVVEGRVRQLSAGPAAAAAAPGISGRHAARDAGWAR
ncbi:high affinity glucose transporter [Stemphylium lycopersici]|nr:high affinity glucose transporter [Stemphylium lycopersici]